MKAEGKYLTPKQRAQQARSQASLEVLRSQGIVKFKVIDYLSTYSRVNHMYDVISYNLFRHILGIDVPMIGEKRPRPGTRIRPNKQRDQQPKDGEADVDPTKNNILETQKSTDSEVAQPVEEEEEEVKDSWDVESLSEEEQTEVQDSNPPQTAKTNAPELSAEKNLKKSAEQNASSSEGSEEDSDDNSDESGSSDDDSDDDESGRQKSEAQSRREKAMERIQVIIFVELFYITWFSTILKKIIYIHVYRKGG